MRELFKHKGVASEKTKIGFRNLTFNTQKLTDLSQITKPPSEMKKYSNEHHYYKNQVEFIHSGDDYRDFVKNETSKYQTLDSRS
jgi:hypothetical protein